jgi:hypothetical protein
MTTNPDRAQLEAMGRRAEPEPEPAKALDPIAHRELRAYVEDRAYGRAQDVVWFDLLDLVDRVAK